MCLYSKSEPAEPLIPETTAAGTHAKALN